MATSHRIHCQTRDHRFGIAFLLLAFLALTTGFLAVPRLAAESGLANNVAGPGGLFDEAVFTGATPAEEAGRSVAGGGDVNGDGFDDIAIGAWKAEPLGRNDTGRVYVVFGTTSPPASLDLGGLNGTNGFVINGIDDNDLAGTSVAIAGDVNDDGFDDIILGAINADPISRTNAGEAYVVFGGATVGSSGSINLSSLNGSNGFIIQGAAMGDQAGVDVNGNRDVNGDNIADVIIGARNASPNGPNSGAAFVLFGDPTLGSSGIVDLSTLTGSDGFRLNGAAALDRAGTSANLLGDINDDGFDDIIVGAFNADPSGKMDAGIAYVVFGSATVGSSGVVELGTLSGTDGFAIPGLDIEDRAGNSVSSAGDVNIDGIEDFLVGAFRADPDGQNEAGEGYLIFGASGIGAGGTFDLATLDGSNGFVLEGEEPEDQAAYRVNLTHDVNGDGIADFLVGANFADTSTITNTGKAYLVYGGGSIGAGGSIELGALTMPTGHIFSGQDAFDLLGSDVSGAGDFNGDGFNDALIAAHLADSNLRSQSGRVRLIFGKEILETYIPAVFSP